MNYLFFISLFAATVGAYAPMNLFKDPAAFVAGLVNANPATIRKMEDMVNDLIDAGQAEKNSHIAAHDDAVAEYQNAVDEHADAKKGEEEAAGAAASATTTFNDKTALEDAAADILLDRTVTLGEKQADFDEKDSIMVSENIRLDNEKALLDKIVPLLESLLPGVSLVQGKLQVVDYIVGRQLLGKDLAAPEAVQRIVDKVNLMIGTGEAERSAANRAQAVATGELAEAVTAHGIAVESHTKAAGELGQATNELARLKGILNVKSVELQDAIEDMNAKEGVMDARKVEMDEQVTRLDAEDLTMHQVLDLLAELNN